MRNLFCLIFIGLILIGCNKNSEKLDSENSDTTTVVQSENCVPYFDFDEVEYYHIDISNEEFHNLVYKQRTNKDSTETMFLNIFSGFYPQGKKDSLNIGELKKFGYKQIEISRNEYDNLNQIFCKKKHKFSESSACGYFNRDILIFKKSEINVGIAKLCFECELSQIIGTSKNTNDFGQSGDFEKLNQLLSKYREK